MVYRGRKVRAGRRFPEPEGPGWFWANQRVGTPGLVEDVGGRKLRVGRRVRGAEVPGSGRRFRVVRCVDVCLFFFSSIFLF